jgi:neutral ceramidase
MNTRVARFRLLALCGPLAVATLICGSAILGAPTGPPPGRAPIKAGFAERDITPALGMEQPGNYGKDYHRSFHDPCKVRVSVFDDGIKRVAIVGVDALMVPRQLVKNVRTGIEQKTGIPGGNVLVSASHSHSSGPIGMIQAGDYDHADELVKDLAYNHSSTADPGYLLTVEKAIVDAVVWADQNKVPAKLGFGRGEEKQVAFNRRQKLKNGQSWSHSGVGNPDIIDYAGPIDPEVGVIAAWDLKDNLIGVTVNYACHCTTNPGGISANWVQYLELVIQGGLQTRAPVVFLQGACGDITQVDNLAKVTRPGGEAMSRFVGGRIGAEAIKVVLGLPTTTEATVDSKSRVWSIKRRIPNPDKVKAAREVVEKRKEESDHTTWAFSKETVLLDALIRKEPEAEVEVQTIQVGPAVFVSNPAEFFVENGLRIKKESPFPFTWPVELANGCTGYVPTEEAFLPSGGGYETRLTSYSNLDITAGTQMTDTGIKLSKEHTPDPEPRFPVPPPFQAPWSYGNLGPELE